MTKDIFKNFEAEKTLQNILEELRSMNEKQHDALEVLRQINFQLDRLNK